MGNKLISGINDLETWCKQNNKENLLSEWDYEKNKDLKPCDVAKTSNQKVWWKCSKGHKWQEIINSKSNTCPYCNKAKRSPSVICIETGIIYQNAIEAIEKMNLSNYASSNIYRCCKGKCKTSSGYHWEYADEKDK